MFDTLLLLVNRSGEVLEKDALLRAIWPDTIVEENNLNQNISTLRRVFGECRGENRFIATVPGRGYRFIPEVRTVSQRSMGQPQNVRIGVLLFENIGASRDREYLADGLTEETIASLGRIDPQHLSTRSPRPAGAEVRQRGFADWGCHQPRVGIYKVRCG